MSIIQLQHDPRLAYPAKNELPGLSQHAQQIAEKTAVITFRHTGIIKPAAIYKNLMVVRDFLISKR